MFWYLFIYSVGTHQVNLLKVLATMGRVAHFVLRVHTAHSGRGLGEKRNEGEWTRNVEIRTRKFLPVGETCMAIF